MNIFNKFKVGLSKSSKNLSSGLNDFIFKKKIEENEKNNEAADAPKSNKKNNEEK